MGLPISQSVNEMNIKKFDLVQLFSQPAANAADDFFRKAMRNIRYQIETSGAQKWLFCSLKPREGKTFVLLSTAYTLFLNNKRVVIVDTNFKNNTLSNLPLEMDVRAQAIQTMVEHYGLQNRFDKVGNLFADGDSRLDIIACKKSELSASELLGSRPFDALLSALCQSYDYVLLEGAALNNFTDAKELMPFVDKTLAVFSAKTHIGQTDRPALNYLHSLNGKLVSAILNRVRLGDSHS